MAKKVKEDTKVKSFTIDDLKTQDQKDDYTYARKRIEQMQIFRKQKHYGSNLETLWADADQAYIPHRLNSGSKRKVIADDETKGWRGAIVNLGESNWQSDIAQANPFTKIQTALSIMIDQNPTGVFTATARQYQATTELMKQLYQRSWEYARSKGQLKLFVHNLAKYGWAIARSYPLRIEREVKIVSNYDQENPDNSTYEKETVVEFNDIMRENLDPRNAWIDDMTKPNSQFSMRDWAWRKVYTMDAAKEEFGKYPLWDKFVTQGGNTQETISEKKVPSGEKTDTDLIEIYFYENRLRDLFIVIANGVPVVMQPLPIADGKGNKKLSCWQTYWNIRHAMSPYGIGIYEAIRYDQSFLDRIRNMTIDQITMSIYKMFFYQGTQTLSDTGDIKITPGVGKQVLNPKDINWMDVPGPGADAYKGIEMFQKDVDDASGITATLEGEITGKTAFELAQAKEASIKRLKAPLDNILDALNDEGYITVSLIQLIYSIPEVHAITDQRLIDDYMHEIQSDPDLYEREPQTNDDGEQLYDAAGLPVSTFKAKVYPEFPLNLDKDEKGNLIETKESEFFRVKPSGLQWEGIINIKAQSILSPSKQIDKALELEMYNVLIPLFAQPPELYKKTAENIVKLYDKDPRDVLPEAWLMTPEQVQQQQPLFVPQDQAGQTGGQLAVNPSQPPQAPPVLNTAPATSNQPSSIVGSTMSKLANPLK